LRAKFGNWRPLPLGATILGAIIIFLLVGRRKEKKEKKEEE
jgi:hypothetical protein